MRTVVLGLLAALALETQAQPVVVSTEVLGPLTGAQATLHPSNVAPNRIDYDGTDLGFTYEHQGKLQFLFGDTTGKPSGEPIQASTKGKYDDAFGTIDLKQWNRPETFSKTSIPPIAIGQNPGSSETAAIDPGHALELFKTPVGGFSNGKREFGVFFTFKPQSCSKDGDCTSGARCDTGLGHIGRAPEDDEGLTFACVKGSTPACQGEPARGLCLDPTSSMWANTALGRVGSVSVKQLIATRDLKVPKRYHVDHTWHTSKFMNPSVRTVQRFSAPQTGKSFTPDYRPATTPGAESRVFVFGRPHFVGAKALGRTVSQYFAYVDLPASEGYAWKPRYFAGLDATGSPTFSDNETDAKPVDLDSSQPGVQAVDDIDLTNQVSIAWVEPLSKWVMFFGGGVITLPMKPNLEKCGLLELFVGPECKRVDVGSGAFHMRTADHPWGPWSPSQELIAPGDPAVAKDQYGPGGMLRHRDCKDATCAPMDSAPERSPDEYGFFYSANIIEQWTRPAGDGVDIIWNASTWAPYRVILLRTHLKR